MTCAFILDYAVRSPLASEVKVFLRTSSLAYVSFAMKEAKGAVARGCFSIAPKPNATRLLLDALDVVRNDSHRAISKPAQWVPQEARYLKGQN